MHFVLRGMARSHSGERFRSGGEMSEREVRRVEDELAHVSTRTRG